MDTDQLKAEDGAPSECLDEDPLGDQACHELVVSFLRRMSEASEVLSTVDGEDQTMTDAGEETIDWFIDTIARNLLDACNPDTLSSGVSNFPKLYVGEKEFPEPDDDEEPFVRPYEPRRTDYLRQLLRLLASSSMDVASKICLSTIASLESSPSSSLEPFILFSHWLPLAPHLAPMVTDLFQNLNEPFEVLDKTKKGNIFIFAEACYNICSFFSDCGNVDTVRFLFDWSFLFNFFRQNVQMSDSNLQPKINLSYETAIQWYSVRCVGKILDWKAAALSHFIEKAGLQSDRVPWRPHPWAIDQEETDIQRAYFRGRATLWGSEEFPIPSTQQIRENLKPSAIIAIVAGGICFYKDGSLRDLDRAEATRDLSQGGGLIQTPTVCRNLSLLGASLCQRSNPMPVLICGPQGSGKSSLVRELLRLCRPKETLIEFHVDEETDSKTLIGSYTITDIPGEFAWRAGPLTHATREGRWVLLEDVDLVPLEIQAALVKLLKDRTLPMGNGKYERCHPNFRLFGTCSTIPVDQRQNRSLRIAANRGGGKRVFNPSLWRKVHVKPLPFSELKEVAMSLYPDMPSAVVESVVSLFQSADRSGRQSDTPPDAWNGVEDKNSDFSEKSADQIRTSVISAIGRDPSVRDFFKLLSRISNSVSFERAASYTTESQRTTCMAESVDVFVGACPDQETKADFVGETAAVTWKISRDLAKNYVETRRPSISVGVDFVDVGRARIHTGPKAKFSQKASNSFAETNHALRLMESIGVCLRENEPVLLVGETGCGKTTLIQQLATICERDLLVQNLSLQTDSTDLLGGFKPLDMKMVARKVYGEFVDIFVSTFSRKQNLKFLKFASSMLEKSNWKKLSQCFQRAADLGTAKMATTVENARKIGPTANSWRKFSELCERFERQRLSCDAGLAFAFSEGLLVDAITLGKWYVSLAIDRFFEH